MFIDFRQRGGKEPVVEALSVTENGTYTPQEGIDGFAPVDVNVDTGIPEAPVDGKQYARQDAAWTEVKAGEQQVFNIIGPFLNPAQGTIKDPEDIIPEAKALNKAVIDKLFLLQEAGIPFSINFYMYQGTTLNNLKSMGTITECDLFKPAKHLRLRGFANFYSCTFFFTFWFDTDTGGLKTGRPINMSPKLPDEAPTDGKMYARQSIYGNGRNSWVELPEATIIYVPEIWKDASDQMAIRYDITPEQKAHNAEIYQPLFDSLSAGKNEEVVLAHKSGKTFYTPESYYASSTYNNITIEYKQTNSGASNDIAVVLLGADGTVTPYRYFELAKADLLANINGKSVYASGDITIKEGFDDAPVDTKLYGRQDGAWVEVPAGGGGVKTYTLYIGELLPNTGAYGPLLPEYLPHNVEVLNELKEMNILEKPNVRIILLDGAHNPSFATICYLVNDWSIKKLSGIRIRGSFSTVVRYTGGKCYCFSISFNENGEHTTTAKQLLDPENVKTINGESIVGTGNIIISGGEGGGVEQVFDIFGPNFSPDTGKPAPVELSEEIKAANKATIDKMKLLVESGKPFSLNYKMPIPDTTNLQEKGELIYVDFRPKYNIFEIRGLYTHPNGKTNVFQMKFDLATGGISGGINIWAKLVDDAPVDTKAYSRQDGKWVEGATKQYVDDMIGTVNNELNLI